jgi:pimeloyl-ACP methyl ester carboxylesterase
VNSPDIGRFRYASCTTFTITRQARRKSSRATATAGDRHAGPVLRAAALARRPARADLHVFPVEVASSHFPFLENPAAFNAVVETFLD